MRALEDARETIEQLTRRGRARQNSASWNRLTSWLRRVEALRAAA